MNQNTKNLFMSKTFWSSLAGVALALNAQYNWVDLSKAMDTITVITAFAATVYSRAVANSKVTF
jgi:hypothetical protein